jgi:hypothetical protein
MQRPYKYLIKLNIIHLIIFLLAKLILLLKQNEENIHFINVKIFAAFVIAANISIKLLF